MRKTLKYFSLLLLVGFAQIEATEGDLKASKTELDAAFISAVEHRQFDRLEELIKAGADVHTPISYTVTEGDCDWTVETTALMYAIKKNNPKMVKLLLSGENKLTEALDVAIREGYLGVVEELIAGGADIHFVNERGDTPLMIAVKSARPAAEFSPQAQEKYRSRWSQRRQIIQTLLMSGADVSHANISGRTALMEAIRHHDFHTVQSLLQTPKIDPASLINAADKDGNTALIHAIQNVQTSYINDQEYHICMNSQNILKTLSETPGIDLFHVNNQGESAFSLLEKLMSKMNGYQ